jgi:hypothetical protein
VADGRIAPARVESDDHVARRRLGGCDGRQAQRSGRENGRHYPQ